jgi:phage shock protein A
MTQPDQNHSLGSTNGDQAEPAVENAWLRDEVKRLEARARRAENALEAMTQSLSDLRRGWAALKAENNDLARRQTRGPEPRTS